MRLFQGNNTNAVNEMLKAGERLTGEGKLIEAYYLYRGLVATNPECKACKAHMALAKEQLKNADIDFTNHPVFKIEHGKANSGTLSAPLNTSK